MSENSTNELLIRMEEKYKKMSKGQKRLADYVTENYDKAVFLTAARLGEVVGVSESTVVRFATQLGYKGYPGFQKALEEVIKIYPSTLKPATQYKVWLTALVQNLLSNLDIPNPTHLATLIVSILDGMTIQAHINKNSVQIEEYWSRVEHLINFEKILS